MMSFPFSPGRSETKIWTPGRAPTVAGRSKKSDETKQRAVRWGWFDFSLE